MELKEAQWSTFHKLYCIWLSDRKQFSSYFETFRTFMAFKKKRVKSQIKFVYILAILIFFMYRHLMFEELINKNKNNCSISFKITRIR